ncbi:hypothetical protein HOU03_gp278 [Caulobacter phage CcrSC]|uniref:Uncharacterized protein n=1 Tax=Caulobacter phage CcrSC TaxID=2283272 RepID=A0A385EEA6_9CAUD|nr:hypothetical protein HOU03_gp278 [Caulobacter phage CcrSC]AXQ69990.1 hypothetical protein CcrSC_gp408 [Caulobacter phage CcrSC]
MSYGTEIALDYEALRASGAVPQNFGLGFIQLKLTEHSRVHFWTGEPNVPEDEIHDHRYDFTSEVIKGFIEHETFDFRPLFAGIERLRLGESLDGWTIENVSCDPNNPAPIGEPRYGRVERTGAYTLQPNSTYWFPKGAFHRSRGSRGAITFLVRHLAEPAPEVPKEIDCPECDGTGLAEAYGEWPVQFETCEVCGGGKKVRNPDYYSPLAGLHARVIRRAGAPKVCPFADPRPPEVLWDLIKEFIER